MQVECACQGRHPSCTKCQGAGEVTRLACKRCGGTGVTGGKCVDCRGLGWRELDQIVMP